MHTRKKHGVIFVVALLSMLGMVVIGTAFVASATQQLQDARRDLDMLHATALADAGLNYFIWKQRYSGSPITTIHDAFSNIYALKPGGTPAPQVTSSTLTFGEATGSVWLFKYTPEGATYDSYQVVAKGYCRDRNRTVRAVLQGPVSSIVGPRPPWMDYAIFADASMVIDTSTNIIGDLASNGNIILNMSGGGGVTGDVRAATTVKIGKNATYVNGSLLYGTAVFDRKNNVLTDAQASTYFSSGVSAIPPDQPRTIPVDGMNPEVYYNWADSLGDDAFYDNTTLSDPSQVTTPVLYVNPDLSAGFTLKIATDLEGPLTIFVNGNVELAGNTTLGTPDNPVAIIATGNITCKGTSTIYGLAWANGTFGGGTPNIHGSVRCQVVGAFQGNPQINWQYYDDDLINPPDFTDMWKQGSWELL